MLYRRCGKQQTYRYADRLSNTNAHRPTHAHKLLHTAILYTKKLPHTDAFTHRSFYTQTLSHKETSLTHTHTQKCLHKSSVQTETFCISNLLHTNALTHSKPLQISFSYKHFNVQQAFTLHTHTQTLLHADVFTHRRFYAKKFLHKKVFTTSKPLHTCFFTHKRFYTEMLYTQTLLHTEALTHKRFYTQKL